MAQMHPADIVMADAKKNPQGVSPEEALTIFANAVLNPATTHYMEGNTIMLVDDEGGGVGEFHFVNAEPVNVFMDNATKLIQMVEREGKFSEIFALTANPKILNGLEGLPFDVTTEPAEGGEVKIIVRF